MVIAVVGEGGDLQVSGREVVFFFAVCGRREKVEVGMGLGEFIPAHHPPASWDHAESGARPIHWSPQQ